MNNPLQKIQIRSRLLGVLIYDSRNAARRKVEECAEAIGTSAEEFKAFEAGAASPTLPQLEMLAIYLNVPLEHFWSRQALTSEIQAQSAEERKRILNLRNRVIGASIRLARSNKGLNQADLAQASGLNEDLLSRFELGEAPVPLPALEILSTILDVPIASFFDQHGPIGKWRDQQAAALKFSELAPDLQRFVSKPINKPYLDIALKLSEMPVDRLRALAENLLEITF